MKTALPSALYGQAQQTVCELAVFAAGKHNIAIINRGPGPVAVDALIAR